MARMAMVIIFQSSGIIITNTPNLLIMLLREKIIQMANDAIARMEARPDRSEEDNDILELLLILRDGVTEVSSEEALDQWLDFMWKVLTDLGFSY